MVHEPMTDLIALMSKLVNLKGNILIPGVDEMDPPPNDEERHVFPQSFISSSLTCFEQGNCTKISTTPSKTWRSRPVPRSLFRRTKRTC
ncbi:hypothetical protein BGW80DRAFT_1327549 [Lactifluus volemus]|nr:hypothetical protein BGW80DRAFT_1327549 [Lactifluus volemus]